MVWAIFAVVTFAGHMVAGFYSNVVYFLAEYVWLISLACSVTAIYRGAKTAGMASAERRTTAIASAVIGAIILLGLCISAPNWLFAPEELPGMLTSLQSATNAVRPV